VTIAEIALYAGERVTVSYGVGSHAQIYTGIVDPPRIDIAREKFFLLTPGGNGAGTELHARPVNSINK
jgi:hypothetical protein